ncbi:response regulator transcription factor [Flavivirga amylovorans]|uniref:Response regulator transcription factor n=1 Tax=Flavivirga amylovorans TaxID=870486 RepID=A0ABT8X3G5_9FLAO|nr:response regulator transcription factor [Flavivirga amylovorans]MDO5988483.1 response regulator transcription factor [Flavivirga amylovorans]
MTKKSTILIADDSVIFAQGLSTLLQQYPDIVKNVLKAKNFKETLQITKTEKIDILILDINFESEEYNGFTIAEKIKTLYPYIKIIILTQQAKIDNYEILFNDIGVDGYLDKQLSVDIAIEAISQIQEGKKYIDSTIKEMLEVGRWMNISSREKEVIEWLSKGYLQKEVADKLCLSIRTIEVHCRNMVKRIGAKNTAHLISIYTKYKGSNRERAPD